MAAAARRFKFQMEGRLKLTGTGWQVIISPKELYDLYIFFSPSSKIDLTGIMLDPHVDRSPDSCCAQPAYISLGISYIKRPYRHENVS